MPRVCKVCQHERQHEINLAIAKRVPERTIADRYHLSKTGVHAHKVRCLPLEVSRTEAARRYRNSESLLRFLETMVEYSRKEMEACDRYLQDPDNSLRYDLGPRAEDIEVIYLDYPMREDENGEQVIAGLPTKRKARLSELLKKTGQPVSSWQWKIADPRELVLKAAMTAKANLELLAKLIGLIKEPGITNNLQVNVYELMPIVKATLEKHPLALAAVDRAIKDAMNGNGHR